MCETKNQRLQILRILQRRQLLLINLWHWFQLDGSDSSQPTFEFKRRSAKYFGISLKDKPKNKKLKSELPFAVSPTYAYRCLRVEPLEHRMVLTGEFFFPQTPVLRDELVPGGFMEHATVYPSRTESQGSVPGPLNLTNATFDNAGGTFDIVLQKSAALASNAAASAAFDRAAAFWESHFTDPISVFIDAHFGTSTLGGSPFGATTLGSASSTGSLLAYSDVLTSLQVDASADESIVNSLPAPGSLAFNLAPGITLAETSNLVSTTTPTNPLMSLNRANAHALGFSNLAGSASLTGGSPVDAQISFNSAFTFDFDKSNGITVGQTDFEAVALHEIGHALGFTSAVDTVDFFRTRSPATADDVFPNTMDLFRLAPGQGVNFATANRILNTGNNVPIQVLHDGQTNLTAMNGSGGLAGLGVGDIPMSTGANRVQPANTTTLGDGNQASHLKANELTGTQIGIMDPTLSTGTVGVVTSTDLRIFGLLGWDWEDNTSPLNGARPTVGINTLTTSDTTPALTGTISEPTAEVFVRLPDAHGLDTVTVLADGAIGAAFGNGTVTVSNAGTSSAKVVRVDLMLPEDVNAFFVDTDSANNGDFRSISGATLVGLISPQDDAFLNDGDVRSRTNLISLTFDDFNPGESFVWDIFIFDESLAAVATGDELAGATVRVEFDNGISVFNKLAAVGAGNPDASNATLISPHYLPATNNANGTWTLPDDTLSDLGAGTYNVEVLAIDSSGAQASDATSSELTISTGTLSAALDESSNLVITDTDGTGKNNTLTISNDGSGYIVITDAVEQFASSGSISGAVLSNGNKTLTVPVASITGTKIIINSALGDDSLDASSATSLGKILDFNGGTGGSDKLSMSGGSTTSQIFSFTNENDGSVVLAGAIAGTINYTGLEPISSSITAANVTLNYSTTTEVITVTQDGTDATLTKADSNVAGEAVSFVNPTDSLHINGGNTGDDTITVTSFGTSGGGFNASLTINGGTGSDTVNLNTDIAFAAGNHLEVDLQNDDVAPGTDVINVGTSATLILSGSGAATLTASKNIALASGSSIATVDGEITIKANQQITPTAGSFIGVVLDGAAISTTGIGDVLLEGRGGDTGSINYGVHLLNGARVESTAMGATAGSITLDGEGGAAVSFNVGIAISSAATLITSRDGAILIAGLGGSDGSDGANSGLDIDAATISSTGTGSNAAQITIVGTGGNGTYGNHGALLAGNAMVTSIDGDIGITGTGGTGTTVNNLGAYIVGAHVSSTGTVAGASITVTGTAGPDGNGPRSIYLQSTATLTSIAAPITLIGDSMNLEAPNAINAGLNTATLKQKTNTKTINLGGADGADLGLTNTELTHITAGTVQIGDTNSGTITLSAAIDLANAATLELTTGSDITQSFTGTALSGDTLIVKGRLAPGLFSTGSVNVDGPVTFDPAAGYSVNLNGTSAYDQLVVAGDNRTITLGGADLAITLDSVPVLASGDIFKIIDSTGTGSTVSGTFKFAGTTLNNNDTFTVGTTLFRIHYNPSGAQGDVTITEAVRFETTVSLVAGVLTITDTNGGESDDHLTVSHVAGNYTITDSTGSLLTTAISGATGTGTSTLNVPNTGVTRILFDGLGGNDNITIDVSVPINATLLGGAGNDTMQAGLGANILDGGAGNDTLRGGAGNDTYRFNTTTQLNSDSITDTAGVDTLSFVGSTNNITVSLGAISPQVVNGNLTLTLNSATSIEYLTGGSGNDALTGNTLNNILQGGPGDDSLNGGLGNDSYSFVTNTQLNADIITDPAGIDTLYFVGSANNITMDLSLTSAQTVNGNLTLTLNSPTSMENLYGGSGNDTLTGNALANVLIGGQGDDSLNGNAGNDIYSFNTSTQLNSDTITDTAGVDLLSFVGSTNNVAVDLGLTTVQTVNSNLKLTLNSATSIENLTGGSGNDTLTGNTLANTVVGGLGNDSLNGGAGNDTYPYNTNSQLNADNIADTAGIDTLSFVGSISNVIVDLSLTTAQSVNGNLTLTLNSATSMEYLTGGSGNDTLTGNSLNNILQGGPGDDSLNGGLGNDSYSFLTNTQLNSDNVTDPAGIDTLYFVGSTNSITVDLGLTTAQTVNSNLTLTLNSGSSMENLYGGAGTNVLIGNANVNILLGGISNDVLSGGAGNDTLTGGEGRNILIGGAGADRLTGGGNQDLLIAAPYTEERNQAALTALRGEWTSANSYENRVDHLLGTLGGGNNGMFTLTPTTVKEDSVADTLIGGSGRDWYLRNLSGSVPAQHDTVTETDSDSVFTEVSTWL